MKNQKPQERRKLSKKKRKQLERLLDQKDKKEKRGELLERLSQLQVPTTELEKYSSIAHLGTNHTHKALSKLPDKNFNGKINTVKGKNRKWQVIEEDEPSQALTESSSDESEMEELSEDLPAAKIEMKADSEENVLQPGSENPNKKRKISDEEQSDELERKKLRKANPSLKWVAVERCAGIQEGRLQLPILSEEANVLESVSNNDIIIICGETGSGKTTQVPQFLYEAGYGHYGKIGVTEPRRIAAISSAERIRHEMDFKEPIIAHHIRYECKVNDETKISVMTDGVLLNEISTDFLLTKYSVILLDEAHERSVHTDILIGMLSRIGKRVSHL